jgi:very-short-patch-repair endonuclease
MLAGYEVDFFWRLEQLVVEVDGFAYHGSRRKFEDDRRRDTWLAAQGVNVLRVTWQQVRKEPEVVIARLAQTLTRASLHRTTVELHRHA